MGKHIISALVANRPGVLAHVAGLFSARGFNIDSLAVGHTETDQVSRMTIVVDTARVPAHIVEANLRKLVPVMDVTDVKEAWSPYMHPVVVFIMCCLVFAIALEQVGLGGDAQRDQRQGQQQKGQTGRPGNCCDLG